MREADSTSLLQEKNALCEVCTRLGLLYMKNSEKSSSKEAEKFLSESVHLQPDNVQSLLALARLYWRFQSSDKCQGLCRKILMIESGLEEASILLSDTLLTTSLEASIEPLVTLLKLHPANYTALSRLIKLMQRSGTINDSKTYLTSAVNSSSLNPGAQLAGLYFCQGLYARYANDILEVILYQII
jgi:hypothetical protein